jgi:ATP-dependent helicase/nuclease subunit A
MMCAVRRMGEGTAETLGLFDDVPETPRPAEGPRWTEAQRRAIEHVGGDLLVSAGAGSGKTAVLAERCARLVTAARDAVRVDQLLVMTFTEAAANEMRTRIAAAIRGKMQGENARGAGDGEMSLAHQLAQVERASIGTIDAFCARLLRTYFHEAGVDPAFEIIDPLEAQLLRAETLEGVLATWHGLAADEPRAAAFARLWEAYEQGGDASLNRAVMQVDGLLSTLAEPEEWLGRVRRQYTAAGVAAETARELELQARGIARQIEDAPGDDAAVAGMIGVLQAARAAVEGAAALLRESDASVEPWEAGRGMLLDIPWPAKVTPKSPAAKCFKDDVYDSVKKLVKPLTDEHFPKALTRQRMIDDMVAQAPLVETLLQLVGDFQAAYRAAKRQSNRLDFNDIKRRAYQLLAPENSAATADLRRRYAHVLVDEVQDINPLDAAIIERARNPAAFQGRGNLFLVGDVKQSIFGFRLADPSIFLNKQDVLRNAAAAAVVDLQHNFRSHPELLGALNGVFTKLLAQPVSGIDYAAHHTLLPPAVPVVTLDGASSATFPGAPVECWLTLNKSAQKKYDAADGAAVKEAQGEGAEAAEGEEDAGDAQAVAPTDSEREAAGIGRRIQQLMAEGKQVRARDGGMRPLAYRDVVILLRGAKSAAPRLARALALAGIPVHAELSSGFFDTPEVREFIALLQMIDNPLQDIAAATAMLAAFGGFSHDDLATIRLAYEDKKDVPFAVAVQRYAGEHAGIASEANAGALEARLDAFHARLEKYRQLTRTLALHEAIAEMFRESGILITLAAQAGGTQRVANLQMLHQYALEFSSFRRQGLFRFLEFLNRLRDEEADFGEASILSEASDVVRIMTIHKSKGLEFPVVIVAALGANFPGDHRKIRPDRHLGLALHVADLQRDIYYPSAATRRSELAQQRAERAEELRLLYVALTRPREHLILSGVTSRLPEDYPKCAGPVLPEDVVLGARKMLDWCLSAARNTVGLIKIEINKDPQTDTARGHAVEAADPLAVLETVSDDDVAAVAPALERLVPTGKSTGVTAVPALVSVTNLKHRLAALLPEDAPVAEAGESGERALPARTLERPSWLREQAPIAADRGSATHLLLQYVDLAALDGLGDLRGQLDALVERGRMTAEQAGLITLGDVGWFLFETELGERLRRMARDEASGTGPVASLRRELGFSWMIPPGVGDGRGEGNAEGGIAEANERRDLQQLRGIIDLLVLAPDVVEIVDYKTDSPTRLTEQTKAGYRIQMNLYARAAENILGRPVRAAQVVYLSARVLETIESPATRVR